MSAALAPALDGRPAVRDRRRGCPERLLPGMPEDRLWGWLGPLAVTAFAAALRLYHLGRPRGMIFDEIYYATDAHNLLGHGVELAKDGRSGAFVVHPALGKWVIAAGQWLFGYNEVGWRASAVVVGALSVLVLARVARRMTRSTLLGCVAGLLLSLDGLHFVQSRTAMLDLFLMAWVVFAFACLVADRDAGRARLAARTAGSPLARSAGGPHLGLRPWRIGAGLCLGAACATKWSGVYYLLAFALLAFLWDVGARRTLAVPSPVRSALRRDLPALLLVLGALPVLCYLASWTGWLATGNGWDRHWADHRSTAAVFVPAALRSLWHYHWEIWHFHTTLTAKHPYQSHPAGWLVLARPVSYFYTSPAFRQFGCTAPGGCSREVLAIGTPAIWWASVAALVATGWLWISRRDWRAAAVLVGVAVGILPWVPDDLHHRTMFLFYALPALPFLVLALTLCAGWALGPTGATAGRRRAGAVGVGAYLCLVAVNFFGLYPVLAAQTIPYASWHARMWFGGWI